ncbi:hypothetical protein AGMMS49944_08820 [Spirochaetia bacterium]|nr:hypothetical protein AGMMS49944_08820 [Spirochaetia bacterium]
MNNNEGLKDFYTKCINCELCPCLTLDKFEHEREIEQKLKQKGESLYPLKCEPYFLRDIEKGIPPRGFYFQNSPVEILVVGQNPGHPFEDEKLKLQRKPGESLIERWFCFFKKIYDKIPNSTDQTLIFHKNLFRYISFILDITDNLMDFKNVQENYNPNIFNETYRRIAFTNLVKCSTRNERQKLTDDLIAPCYKKYFLNEIKYFQPKVILALGRDVENYLKRQKNYPKKQIINIRHPTLFYRKEEEKEKLENIKKSIHELLK